MGSCPSTPSQEEASILLAGLDTSCADAAQAISEADVLLLCTGAGFSADSGLAVYADVAKVEAYAKRELSYYDICQPHWLEEEPQLFWGFWGQCFNDYRGTAPHQGYEIIEKWVEQRFRHSKTAQILRERIAAATGLKGPDAEDADASPDVDPYAVEGHAGAFFVFTSNVDAHHFDWARACEVRECHGNTELYQCAKGESRGACMGVWRAPIDFRFNVDTVSMLAPRGDVAKESWLDEMQAVATTVGEDEEAIKGEVAIPGKPVPRVGRVQGGGRPTLLRHMSMPTESDQRATKVATSFATNHPMCQHCGGAARPAILMFGDFGWQDVESQDRRWDRWTSAVRRYSHQRETSQDEPRLRITILEIGAGGNVTTVRSTSESQFTNFREAGAIVKLIRVNPELPLGDGTPFKPGARNGEFVVSVMSRGLEALQRIDTCMATLEPAPETA